MVTGHYLREEEGHHLLRILVFLHLWALLLKLIDSRCFLLYYYYSVIISFVLYYSFCKKSIFLLYYYYVKITLKLIKNTYFLQLFKIPLCIDCIVLLLSQTDMNMKYKLLIIIQFYFIHSFKSNNLNIAKLK